MLISVDVDMRVMSVRCRYGETGVLMILTPGEKDRPGSDRGAAVSASSGLARPGLSVS